MEGLCLAFSSFGSIKRIQEAPAATCTAWFSLSTAWFGMLDLNAGVETNLKITEWSVSPKWKQALRGGWINSFKSFNWQLWNEGCEVTIPGWLFYSLGLSFWCGQQQVAILLEKLQAKLFQNSLVLLLLMEEILHHLGCTKPCKFWDSYLVQDFFYQQ